MKIRKIKLTEAGITVPDGKTWKILSVSLVKKVKKETGRIE